MTDDEPQAFNNRCPVCQVKPGEKCTQPTDTGRKPVDWFHFGRRLNVATEKESNNG